MSETNVPVYPVVHHLDLFSGIGGFALAAQMVGGIETIGFCEIDPWARQVLAKNFPSVPIHDDVKTLDPKDYGRIDLITGGYPCQPFSSAGQRKGEDDDRHLWPEVFRLIKSSRPRWVLCENVAGHITLGLDKVLSQLESEGYAAEPIVIPACAVNAPHRRDRVWIIAHCESEQSADGILGEARKKGKRKSGGSAFSGVASCADSKRLQGSGKEGKVDRTKYDDEFEKPWLEVASKLCRMDDGVSKKLDEPRLKGCGNAIVPQVAAEILRVMMAVEHRADSSRSSCE